MKSCAIVDLFSSHDHLIPSIIHYLQALGYQVDVYSTTPQFKQVSQLLPALEYDVHLFSPPQYGKGNLRYCRDRWLLDFRPLQFLREYDLVFLNTFRTELALTSALTNLCTRVLTISHTPQHALKKPRFKKFIQRGHQAFVYSEAIGLKYRLPWMTPLTYADFDCFSKKTLGEPKVFCVSGTIRFSGRNYLALVRAVAELKQAGETNFKVKILGRHSPDDSPKFLQAIQDLDVGEFFEFVENTSHPEYLQELHAVDFVLPLIDRFEEQLSARHYEDVATSAIFMALGLAKATIVERELAQAYRIEGACLEHTGGRLAEGMLTAMHATAEEITAIEEAAAARSLKIQKASLENLENVIRQLP